MPHKYDVFISHASKDKNKYVEYLVKAIKDKKLKVFYDIDSIGWGDSVSEKIEEGIEDSRLAVVVISKNYFGREWTEYELKSLLARQDKEGKKFILPILYRITKKQLIKHYPKLCDISYKYSKSCSCEKMAELIVKKLEMQEI